MQSTWFKSFAVSCAVLSTAIPGLEAFLSSGPRIRLLSAVQQRSLSCRFDTSTAVDQTFSELRPSINADDNTNTNTNTDTEGWQASPSSIGRQPPQELVLREFSMPLQSSPGAYERRVVRDCLKEGGEAATVVRWHISSADEQTGQARVEVRHHMVYTCMQCANRERGIANLGGGKIAVG